MSESSHIEQHTSSKESQIISLAYHPTVSSASSTWKNEPHVVMLRYYDKLITALSVDPVGIAERLLAKGLIPEHTVAQMHQNSTAYEKATVLVTTVRQRIEIAPERFDEFLDILSGLGWARDIIEVLRPYGKQLRKDESMWTGSIEIPSANTSDEDQSDSEYTFPTLDSDNDEEELEAQLMLLVKSLKKSFSTLLWETILSFKSQNVDTASLVTGILAFTEYEDTINKSLQDQEKEVLERARYDLSVDRIFDILRPHMTFFDYEILEFLIQTQGSKQNKRGFLSYLRKFKSFCRRIVFEVPSTGSSPKQRPKFVVKITRNFRSALLIGNTFTLNEVKYIKQKLASVLKLRTSSLYLDFIGDDENTKEATRKEESKPIEVIGVEASNDTKPTKEGYTSAAEESKAIMVTGHGKQTSDDDTNIKQQAQMTTGHAPSLSPNLMMLKVVKEVELSSTDEKQSSEMDLKSGDTCTPTETSFIIRNLKDFNEKATNYVQAEIESIVARYRDKVHDLQKETATLSKEKIQLLRQLDEELESQWESGLHGVDVCGKISLTVSNNTQQFVWKTFGLKLTIPSGVLPPGVDQCELLIKASLSGHYQLPKNYHLVSPFFWLRCEPYCKFAKPIALEIQHCALDQNLQRLSFVKALCTQKELPYSFEIISGGRFSESSSYGLIELNSFSGTGIGQKGSEERGYCASLFYLTSSIHDRQVHFTVTWNTEAHRNVTQRHYARLNATSGSEQEVEFESDAITLDIPEGDGATRDSWKIVPLMRPRITKKQVDSFKKGRRIPHCSLQVLKLNNIRETKMYRVNLLGAKDNSFIVIRLSPENLSESISQDFGAYEEKHFIYLMTRLKDHAAEWKFIGCYLGFSQGQLKNIESNPTLLAKAPVSFLSELLTQWLQRGSATLESLKFALNQADLGVVAHEIVIP